MQDIEELSKSRAYEDRTLTKQERKQIEVEESLETLSRYLDGLFRIPGTGWRFGLDSLIGLVPNVGDISTALVSFYILVAGVRYGVPKITLLRMAVNIGLDYLVGVIPFVGDAFDFFWKANQQNMDLIKRYGQGKGSGTGGDYVFVAVTIAILIGILAGSIFLSLFIIWVIIGGLWSFLAQLG
ncbi:MAG: DUF4112 domain-containing protein [Acidobacteria bacterium]|nr:MAG: DUF4112 domain-containing protein [Acidobacteriota bacterium]REK02916.1 MAG: DUF4112 domain-containing protein [Acidobacteriota bacterium]REK13280.1 MAG: DUF4112 domain-containing protein [Acidobacteriota bacterium]REK41274.1 MAG: DUF4112 domain-containing protein [Acidobacteriota bacterium]